jgi:hypothetical protein
MEGLMDVVFCNWGSVGIHASIKSEQSITELKFTSLAFLCVVFPANKVMCVTSVA